MTPTPIVLGDFGARVGQLRQRRRWSQLRLATACGLTTHQAVSHWESGHRLPHLPTLCLLADTFGVTLDYLLRGRA